MSESSTLPREITAAEAARRADVSTLVFTTTADLTPLTTMVGQERAVRALELGLGMPQQGITFLSQDWQVQASVPRLRAYYGQQPRHCRHQATGSMCTISVPLINPRRCLWRLARGSAYSTIWSVW